MVHGDGKTRSKNSGQAETKTLVDLILAEYPEMEKVGEPLIIPNAKIKDEDIKKDDSSNIIYRPGIVHRLDKDTSGVLIVVRNQEAFDFFKEQFQKREIKKNYKAFVWGWVKEDKGVVNKPIGRSKKDFRMWSAQRGARGELREAVTNYRVLKRFTTENKDRIEEKFTLVDIFPQTGRTHQIRVHFKYLNHPLVGDSLYAGKKESVLGFSRLALHAFSLEFISPSSKNLKIEAPLPEDFTKIMTGLNL